MCEGWFITRKVNKRVGIWFFILLVLAFCQGPLPAYSQREFNNWYFGKHAGVSFNSGNPVALTNCATSFAEKYCPFSVSDSSGNLLFYAGIYFESENLQGTVYDKSHLVMPNGHYLYTGWDTKQNYLAVQKLNDDSSYFLFAMDEGYTLNYTNPKGLTYSVVDLRLNGGYGDIVPGQKSIQVPGAEQTNYMLSCTRHKNNHDVWVTVRKYVNSNSYLTYLITAAGINTVPVVSSSLFNLVYPYNLFYSSMIRFSPDGTKLVCLYSDSLEYCQFNNLSGAITPMFKIHTFGSQSPNAEFSVNGKYLYIFTHENNGSIHQYDATKTDSLQFIQSKILISTISMTEAWLQRGPDDKIYVTELMKDSLAVIQNPTMNGTGCNYQRNAVFLGAGNHCNQGLPQFLQRYYVYFHHSNMLCAGDTVSYNSSIWPPPDSIQWNFGDPASGPANFSTVANPTHSYSSPGNYTVELYVRHNDNRTDTTWQTITIQSAPQPVLGPDKTILQGNSVTFDAGFCSGCTYQWSNLTLGNPNIGTGQTYTTGVAGIFMVSVTNPNGCTGRDTVQLTVIPPNPVSQVPYEFWFAAPSVTNHTIPPSPLNYTNLNQPVRLYISTIEGPAAIRVDQPANPAFIPISLTAANNTSTEVNLTPFIDLIENTPANTVLNRGLRISSDKRINVIYEVQSLDNAATYTLTGKNSLGYEFIIPAQSHMNNYTYSDPPARNAFDVVATEDSTIIQVVPRKAIIGHVALDTFAVVLNRGQTWSGRASAGDSTSHLGGSFVLSNKPIAVTITDDAIYDQSTGENSWDITGDQLYPRNLCGTEFILTNYEYPKLLAYAFEDHTTVTLVDSTNIITHTINRGESAEFTLDESIVLPFGISGHLYSDKPIFLYELAQQVFPAAASFKSAAAVVPPITCTGSKKVILTRTPPGGVGSFNDFRFTIVTKNGNQGNIQIQPNWFLTPFYKVPGTNGAYVYKYCDINSNGGLLYNDFIVTSTGGRFQVSTASYSSTITLPISGLFEKFAFLSDYSKLFLGPDRSMCPGDSILLDAGSGKTSYLWNTGNTSPTIWVKTAGTYWVSTTEPDCQLSDTIVISYYPHTPVNLGQNRTICQGDSTLLNAGSGRSWYLWNTGETTQTIWVKNPGQYWVWVPDVYCNISDTVLVASTATPIVTNNQPLSKTVCPGEPTNITLTGNLPGVMFHWIATLTSGNISGFSADSGLVINQILINNGATAGVVTYHITPKIGDCAGTAVDYTVSVNVGNQVYVAINASGNTVCAGTPVTFTASGNPTGTSPSWQWKVNGVNTGTGGQVFTYTPANGDCITCVLTSNALCVTSNPATSNQICMTVNQLNPVNLTISSTSTHTCAGTPVTFNAFPTNPGNNPVYQWKVNGTIAGSNSQIFTYMPINGDCITCQLTSDISCPTGNPALSNTICMIVDQPLPVSVTVTTPVMTVCEGTSVTFTANPTHGGTLPGYQWKVNTANIAGATNSTYTYVPTNGDVVTCKLTSSDNCVTGNPAISPPVTMTVSQNFVVTISISASSNPFCAGSQVTFTSNAGNAGGSPGYQWKVNGINATNATNASYAYAPANGDQVSCILNSSASCITGNPALSNIITMMVNTNMPAGVSISTLTNPFCPGTSVTITAVPTNGGLAPVYQWKLNGANAGTNLPTFTFNPAAGDSVRCVMTSNLNCVTGNPASSTRIIMSERAAPNVTFTSCFDTVTFLSAQPFILHGGLPLGGQYSGPGVNTGIFTPSVAGIGLKTITYGYSNVYTCLATKTKTILVQPNPSFTCGNNLTDIRDNKIYPTVQIGSQCWMAANLDFGIQIPDGTPQTDNCTPEKYLRPTSFVPRPTFYQWDELMRYQTSPGAQGLCPPGWHIPSASEWNVLLNFYPGAGQAGGYLKDSLLVSGFHSYQHGFLYLNNTWAFTSGLDAGAMYWTSTTSGADRAVARGLNIFNPSVSMYPSSRQNAFGVRCLRD